MPVVDLTVCYRRTESGSAVIQANVPQSVLDGGDLDAWVQQHVPQQVVHKAMRADRTETVISTVEITA